MLVKKGSYFNGDTMIEVLFAVSIFSLLAVCCLSIMNQGTSTAQRSLEITLVRQEIDSQAEILRYLNEAYASSYQSGTSYSEYFDSAGEIDKPAGQWAYMMKNLDDNYSKSSASDFASLKDGRCPDLPPGSFIMNTRKIQYINPESTSNIFKDAVTFSQVRYNEINNNVYESQGIWVEAIHKTFTDEQKNSGYVDFHIRACWEDPSQEIPMTLGTIVRLYEPRG